MALWHHVPFAVILGIACAACGGGSVAALREGKTLAGPHWGEGVGCFVLIVGQVDGVRVRNAASGEHELRLRALATLSGKYDPGSGEALVVPFWIADFGQPIKEPPQPGQTVLVLLFRRADGYVVSSQWSDFMPERRTMVAVAGLGDARIGETLSRIQAERVRAKPDGEREPSDEDRLRTGGPTPFPLAERLRIAATSTEPRALWLLATDTQPLEVQVLVAMNPHTRADIVEAYATHEHPLLRAAAEWNLRQREVASSQPATQPTTREAQESD